MQEVKEAGGFIYKNEKCIVRIHDGKLTKEERKAVLEDAIKIFHKTTQAKLANKEAIAK